MSEGLRVVNFYFASQLVLHAEIAELTRPVSGEVPRAREYARLQGLQCHLKLKCWLYLNESPRFQMRLTREENKRLEEKLLFYV